MPKLQAQTSQVLCTTLLVGGWVGMLASRTKTNERQTVSLRLRESRGTLIRPRQNALRPSFCPPSKGSAILNRIPICQSHLRQHSPRVIQSPQTGNPALQQLGLPEFVVCVTGALVAPAKSPPGRRRYEECSTSSIVARVPYIDSCAICESARQFSRGREHGISGQGLGPSGLAL